MGAMLSAFSKRTLSIMHASTASLPLRTDIKFRGFAPSQLEGSGIGPAARSEMP